MTSATNPWNEIYRIAAGRKQAALTTTLRQNNGTLTTYTKLLHTRYRTSHQKTNKLTIMHYTSRSGQ